MALHIHPRVALLSNSLRVNLPALPAYQTHGPGGLMTMLELISIQKQKPRLEGGVGVSRSLHRVLSSRSLELSANQATNSRVADPGVNPPPPPPRQKEAEYAA